MDDIKKANPIKMMAIHLAHQMDRENEMYETPKLDWEIEEIKENGRELRNDIVRKGYDIGTLLYFVGQYKTINFKEYQEWLYN
jgi:hypothetical protein